MRSAYPAVRHALIGLHGPVAKPRFLIPPFSNPRKETPKSQTYETFLPPYQRDRVARATGHPTGRCPNSTPPPVEEKTVKLSPFEVRTEKDQGYIATSTLAGSRLNTALIDTPASISVMTKEFLDDIGATNVVTALSYALNAERDTTEPTGNPSASQDIPVKIRGFSAATLARNYFGWTLESDIYNIERLDFSRGPNSILFGTGGPGGIINTTTKRALFGRNVTQFGLRTGAYDEYRATVDVSRQLGQKIALRVNVLEQRADNWRDFVYENRKGVALAVTARPFRDTEIRFDGEYGDLRRGYSNPYLTGDSLSPWLNAGRPRSATYGAAVAGTIRSATRGLVHDPDAGTVQSWFGSVETASAGGSPSVAFPRSLTDFSVFPLKGNIGGAGNRVDSMFRTGSLFIEQRFGDLQIELAGNRQESDRLITNTIWSDANYIRADANAVQPNGQPNPNFGRSYVESNARPATQDAIRDEVRMIAAYTLDLRKRNPWFGDYAVSAYWSDRRTENRNSTLFEVNLTPAGDALFPLNVTNINNRIYRRVYLDPFGPGRKGGVDPLAHPINQNGVTSGFVGLQQRPHSAQELRTEMVAGQAKLLKDHLVVTGGWRRDEQKSFTGIATVVDPRTGFAAQTRLNPVSIDYAGETTTLGMVLHVRPWASLVYNRSNNFNPQAGNTIDDRELGPRLGKGEDYGLKFRLFGGKVYASATRYSTKDVNRGISNDASINLAIREIYEALDGSDPIGAFRNSDSADTEGKGYEFEVVTNLTPQWRMAFNLAQTEGTQANYAPVIRSYIARNRATWTAAGARSLIAPISGVPAIDPKTGRAATIQTALDALDAQLANISGQNGVTQRQLREYTGSVFTTYTFDSGPRWLKDLSVGGGVRYRGKPVVGYINGLAPVYGDSEVKVDLLLKKQLRLMNRRVQVQANFDNILNENKLIVADADLAGKYRYLYPSPFRWSLSATLDF